CWSSSESDSSRLSVISSRPSVSRLSVASSRLSVASSRLSVASNRLSVASSRLSVVSSRSRRSSFSRSIHEAYGPCSFWEWIPYEGFSDVQYLSKGEFGTMFVATWVNGPRDLWDDDLKQYVRRKHYKVALKRLDKDIINLEAHEIFQTIQLWDNSLFRSIDEKLSSNSKSSDGEVKVHPEAIYTSRPLSGIITQGYGLEFTLPQDNSRKSIHLENSETQDKDKIRETISKKRRSDLVLKPTAAQRISVSNDIPTIKVHKYDSEPSDEEED
ncbi:17520_t:CDS:2, partial [Racocetra fulgida]